jgi:hypothetical protein
MRMVSCKSRCGDSFSEYADYIIVSTDSLRCLPGRVRMKDCRWWRERTKLKFLTQLEHR